MERTSNHQSVEAELRALCARRVAILDGAMGTALRARELAETDGCVARPNHDRPLAGNYDALCLSRPGLVEALHRRYMEAGCDIICTNSFNANRISQAAWGLADSSRALNLAAAQIARRAVREQAALTPHRPRFVAGAMGPTPYMLSRAPTQSDDGVSFVTVQAAYAEQAAGLLQGGVDVLLVETIVDTLTLKACLAGIEEATQGEGGCPPILLSVALLDHSGRTASGQTLRAFCEAVWHARPLSIGLNCSSLGGEAIRPFLQELGRESRALVSWCPNAGLPNSTGSYEQLPEQAAALAGGLARSGLLNLVGGCCGTTPEHIRAVAGAVSKVAPRLSAASAAEPALSGLELLCLKELPFLAIGECTFSLGENQYSANATRGRDWRATAELARSQVEAGAKALSVNLDELEFPSTEATTRFMKAALGEPALSKVPLLLGSMHWERVLAGLRCLQGKGIAACLNVERGEHLLLRQARQARSLGAALWVALPAAPSGAVSIEDQFAACARAYRQLTEKAGVPPEDLCIDPGVPAVGRGSGRSVAGFLELTRRLREDLRGARVSATIRHVSRAFPGNATAQEALEAVFLRHAMDAGLTLGIVPPGRVGAHNRLSGDLLGAAEDVLFGRHADATQRLNLACEEPALRGAERS